MANTKRITVGPAAHIKTVRKLVRAWDRATNAESNADTYERALKLANASQRALTALRAAQNGTTVEPKRTARNLAKLGLAALANIGRTIARAIAAKSALVKARAANVARVAARKVRISLRMALAAVVALALTITTKDTVMTTNKPITAKLATCYKPNEANNVPAPDHAIIYRDNLNGVFQLHVVRGQICEKLHTVKSERLAMRLATNLGFTETVIHEQIS